ncbi:MAG: hypothetical protein A2X49_05695 [Lentisphaerae bacterium GWF2_52_8]|nr:MAG: hypothetical protein A2X49_05695 [Lentisphaerae bacterium GWF2_52_8]
MIELLVVIAIISILAALLFPALSRGREIAKKIQCVSNQKQLGILASYYASDYKHFVPSYQDRNGLTYGQYWYASLAEEGGYMSVGGHYGPTKAIPPNDQCPNLVISIFKCTNGFNHNNYVGQDKYRISFWYQASHYAVTSDPVNMLQVASATNRGTRLPEVKNPSSRVFLYDDGEIGSKIPGAAADPRRLAAETTFSTWKDIVKRDFLTGRHANIDNGLFYDGHVEPMLSKKVSDHYYYMTGTNVNRIFNIRL